MKKQVAEFVKKFKCTAHYDGNTRTMFIRRSRTANKVSTRKNPVVLVDLAEVHREVLKEFGMGLSFTLA